MHYGTYHFLVLWPRLAIWHVYYRAYCSQKRTKKHRKEDKKNTLFILALWSCMQVSVKGHVVIDEWRWPWKLSRSVMPSYGQRQFSSCNWDVSMVHSLVTANKLPRNWVEALIWFFGHFIRSMVIHGPCLIPIKHLKNTLCKKKVLHHIKLAVYVWSTKYRWNQKLIVQFGCILRVESFEPN